jgi:hypothetical protein
MTVDASDGQEWKQLEITQVVSKQKMSYKYAYQLRLKAEMI